MAVELQGVLNRINEDGIAAAEAEKQKILEAARKEAAAITDRAKADAEKVVAEARRQAATLQASGEAGLQQAARDVMISLEGQIRGLLDQAADAAVGAAITPEALAEIVVALARSYAEKQGTVTSLELLAAPDQVDALQALLQSKLSEQLRTGLTIKPVAAIDSGIQVSFDGAALVHDFTSEAIAEMLCAYLNPRILAIIRKDNAQPA